MKKISWDSSSYSVGVPILDEQHKKLVSMINVIIANPDATVSSETVSELLSGLTSYAEEHFRTEENILEKNNFPEIVQHREEHMEYRIKVVELCQATIKHEVGVPVELKQFLHKWWLNHILESDMNYKSYLDGMS